MRAAYFIIIASLFCLLPALSATALQPMDDFAMDNVQAQSGIAIGLDNIQVYSHRGWAYEATDGGVNKKISFEDTVSYMILNTRNPITFRVMQNPAGVAMLELTGQPSIWLHMDTNDFTFAGQDMGSLHLRLRPPDGPLMGFMEEFLLYAAPLGTQDGFDGDGIAFQLETRSGIDELRWAYNTENDDSFWFKGVYMAGEFDPGDIGNDTLGPDQWDPTGRFVIGNVDAYANDSLLGPATIQVIPDPDDLSNQGYAMLRLNLPMQGSTRIHEVGMYVVDDQGPTPPPNWPEEPNPGNAEFIADDFGPIIIDNMRFDHLQVDFKTYTPGP